MYVFYWYLTDTNTRYLIFVDIVSGESWDVKSIKLSKRDRYCEINAFDDYFDVPMEKILFKSDITDDCDIIINRSKNEPFSRDCIPLSFKNIIEIQSKQYFKADDEPVLFIEA